MKKGVLKQNKLNAFKIGYMSISAGLILTGIGFAIGFSRDIRKTKIQKEDLFFNYTQSEEYSQILEMQLEEYSLDLANREISSKEFKNRVDYLSSDEFIEWAIMNGDNLEFKTKLENLNEKNSKAMGKTGIALMSGCLSALAVAGTCHMIDGNLANDEEKTI